MELESFGSRVSIRRNAFLRTPVQVRSVLVLSWSHLLISPVTCWDRVVLII